MASNRKPSIKKRRSGKLKYILLCFLGVGLGFYLLNYVAPMEKPVLGNTFHIIAGCALIAVFSILIMLLVQKQYFPNKKPKRKRNRPVFLKDGKKSESDES